MFANLESVADVLGLRRKEVTLMSLIDSITGGLPVKALDRVVSCLAPSDAGFRYLVVPKATLERRRKQASAKLTADEGAKVARLAKVWAAALDVWKTEEDARDFLFRAHPLLDGRRPIDVALDTELGAQLVEEILGRLKYGTAP